jgi:replicative DNA helicase
MISTSTKESIKQTIKFEDPGSERAVLFAILSNSGKAIEVFYGVNEKDFITQHNRSIYACLYALFSMDGVIVFDQQTVVNKATSLGLLEKCGGAEYISSLFDAGASSDNLKISMNAMVENSSKKKLYDQLAIAQKEITSNIFGQNIKSASELVSLVESEVSSVSAYLNRVEDAEDVGKGIVEFVEGLASAPTKIKGVETGFRYLDERINGLIPGSLTILAARAKCGKSMVLVNWAKYMVYGISTVSDKKIDKEPVPVLYIDTEMSSEEVKIRMLSSLSGVKERLIANGSFGGIKENKVRVMEAAKIMSRGGFYHRYVPGATVDKISSLARKYKARKNIGVLIYDYIKLPDSADLRRVREDQYLGEITAALKDIAGTLQIPVVSAAQIGRTGADKNYLTPSMIADSDRLLRYCNNLLGFCYKSKKEMGETEENIKAYSRMNGDHRLQILAARAGGTFFEGINVFMRPAVIKVEESINQLHTEDSREIDNDF